MIYTVKIINSYNEKKTIEYKPNEFNNLMQMIFHVLNEEIGDCKGRAWCGTCHVQVIQGAIETPLDNDEVSTLLKLYNKTPSSRLACQIEADQKIHGMTFKLLSDDA